MTAKKFRASVVVEMEFDADIGSDPQTQPCGFRWVKIFLPKQASDKERAFMCYCMSGALVAHAQDQDHPNVDPDDRLDPGTHHFEHGLYDKQVIELEETIK